MNERSDLLTLAVIGNYVLAALLGVGACFPLIHLTIGISILMGVFPVAGGDDAMASTLVGGIFVTVAVILITLFATLAILTFLCARRIAARRSFTFVLIVSAVQCSFMPIGTALGVFTLWLIHQDGVKAQFRG